MNIGNGQIKGSRDTQQDYFASVCQNDQVLLVLADGIGGLSAGHIASEVAVKAFVSSFKELHNSDSEAKLGYCLRSANRAIADATQEFSEAQGMGTTLVALLIESEKLTWVSVGDSLLYLWRGNTLSRLNQVHTRLVKLEEQVVAGEITKAEAYSDPQKDSITSALQGGKINDVDCQVRTRTHGEGYLIASDGLSTLRIGQIQKSLQESTNAQKNIDSLMTLVENANHPTQDNCTALLVLPDEEIPHIASRRWVWWLTAFILSVVILSGIGYWLLRVDFTQYQSQPEIVIAPSVDNEESKGGILEEQSEGVNAGDTDQKLPAGQEPENAESPTQSGGNQSDSSLNQSGTSPDSDDLKPVPESNPNVETEEIPVPQKQVEQQQQGLSKDREGSKL